MATSPTYSVKGLKLPACPDCGKGLELTRDGRCSYCGFEIGDSIPNLYVVSEEKPARSPEWYIDAADLLERGDPGPTPYLVDGLIVEASILACVGRWKTTKSYGLLDIGISVATGRPAFSKFEIPEPGLVVFVNEESGEAALWRRLDALCRGRGIDRDELRKRLLIAANRRIKLDDPDWQARLIEDGIRLRPRLFIFDPLARMKAAERNESVQNELAPAVEFIRTLRDETAATVGFVHHTGHTGEHMRGTSDLETVWESRIHWTRDGQAELVGIECEHREAEAPPPFKYRIGWDGRTRSMRFDVAPDPFETWTYNYLIAHPGVSANAVYEAAKNRDDRPRKKTVLDLVRRLQQSGSEGGNHSGTTPPERPQASGSPNTPLLRSSRGVGNHLAAEASQLVPDAGTTPSQDSLDDRPDGWLEAAEMFIDEEDDR